MYLIIGVPTMAPGAGRYAESGRRRAHAMTISPWCGAHRTVAIKLSNEWAG
jgi:hypothetical protein